MKKRSFKPFPRTLRECVAPLTAPVFRKHGIEAKLVNDWASIVGTEIAAHTSPGTLRFPKGQKVGGTLTVLVESAYALPLQYQTPLVIEKLAVYFGHRAVERIALSQTRIAEEPPPALPEPPPLPEPTGDGLVDALNRLARYIIK